MPICDGNVQCSAVGAAIRLAIKLELGSFPGAAGRPASTPAHLQAIPFPP